ncbi:RNA polymerase sigma factor [Paracidovorax anthurii]|uniref:RNA polymerase sigma-70 factor (ECF subfamily) n=1 Tax=Paracidovorax anthurii TaxID=78229 RepID=A0A328Z8I4_9BURK|nr:sigma-70 family RNA polymerase sigma factor [Paracidovorax anthurii]RAR80992.1 RNA polymerase sigma-70 factor (ECF subfamily) [Paracidovorax anthurii]
MFEHYRELLNFLALKVRSRDAAADLAQESFARVYAAQRSGSTVRDPRALLFSTARNLLVDAHRRASARLRAAPQDPAEDMVEPDQLAGPDALEPEIALSSRQRFEVVAGVVDRLPPRCRKAFMLVKFDGLTHAETAARMGITVKTVEMQVQIALQACRNALDALDAAPGNARGGKMRAKPVDSEN